MADHAEALERKPDEQDIKDAFTHLDRVWSNTHAHWHLKIDPWYWGTTRIWALESQRSQTIPSRARAIIDHATDTLLAYEPKYTRNPIGLGRSNEEAADRVEIALFQIVLDSMLQDPILAFKQLGKYLSTYGYCVLEGPTWDATVRPVPPVESDFKTGEEFEWAQIDYRNSLKHWNPIGIRAPHPSRILMDPFTRNPGMAIRRERLFVKDVRHLVDQLREMNREDQQVNETVSIPGDRYDQVVVAEYWTDDWHSLALGEGNSLGEQLFIERNAWGFVPYIQAFAGFGQQRTAEDENGSPLNLTQGLLDPILQSLKVHAQSFSAKHTAVLERSYPRTMADPAKIDSAELAQQLARADGILEAGKDDILFLEFPPIERALFQIDQMIDADITLGTYVADVAGQRQQGVSTVGQQAILSTASHRKFEPVLRQLGYMATVLGRNILKLADRNGENISVNGHTLRIADIKHDYNIVGEFQVVDPILQQNARELGLREVQAGLKSDETYRENDLKVASESVELKRLLKQAVRKSPGYIRAIARAVAREDGMLEFLDESDSDEGVIGNMGEEQVPAEARELTAAAGGGSTRSLRQGLTGQVRRPQRQVPRTPARRP